MVDDRGIEKVRGVSFEVRAGEIVGIAGVDGNGQTELIDAIAGPPRARRRARRGRRTRPDAARARAELLDAGVGHIPEDRQRRGLVLEFSIAENIALHDYASRRTRGGWLSRPRRDASARAGCSRSSTSAAAGRRRRPARSPAATSRRSSLAREIARDPKVLIAAQPTRGLDVGAIEFVHRRLVERARRGPRDPAGLARARRDPVALRPHPRHLRGPDRRRAPADVTEEEIGLEMTGGGASEEAA